MSLNVNGYNPYFRGNETAQAAQPQKNTTVTNPVDNSNQAATNPVQMPPSDKKYKKNGKSVRSNIGPFMGTALVLAGTTVASPCWHNIFETKNAMESSKLIIASRKEDLRNLEIGSEKIQCQEIIDFRKNQCNEIIDMQENFLKKCANGIKKEKKNGIISLIIGTTLAIGAVLLTNHNRNKKRAALAAEPEKPTLNKSV